MADRTRTLLVGVVIPVVIGLVGVVLMLIALPDLPDPVAVHWGASGAPDGFGPAWPALVLLPVVVVGYALFTLVVARGGRLTVVQAVVLVTSPFLAVLMTVLIAGSLWLQRGMEDAATAPSIVPLLLGGTVAALAAAVGAWFVLPEKSGSADAGVEPPALALGETERAVWMRRTSVSGVLLGFVLGTLALVSLVAITALVLSGPPLVAAVYGGLLVVIGLLVAGTVFWRVRVADDGLVVRSALGIPRFAVPLADVETATVTQVEPVRDFGGWGLRWGGVGRFGVITRRGEALEVRRRNGKVFIVTVEGAATAAALLNSLVARRGTMS